MKLLRPFPIRQFLFGILGGFVLFVANPVPVKEKTGHVVIEDSWPVVAIQPLGEVDTIVIRKIGSGIEKLFLVQVVVLPAVGLPQSAYYEPSQRYRAEKILVYLDSIAEEHGDEFLNVIGITSVDIATTKGDVYDWGIFGLGYLPGRLCVASTFRLGRKKVGEAKFFERLVKVVNHELGHNFGLDHCPTLRCLMEDAKGTIKTVDQETGELCPDCRTRLKHLRPAEEETNR